MIALKWFELAHVTDVVVVLCLTLVQGLGRLEHDLLEILGEARRVSLLNNAEDFADVPHPPAPPSSEIPQKVNGVHAPGGLALSQEAAKLPVALSDEPFVLVEDGADLLGDLVADLTLFVYRNLGAILEYAGPAHFHVGGVGISGGGVAVPA